MRHAYTAGVIRLMEAPLLRSLPEGTLMARAAHGLAGAVSREISDAWSGLHGRRVLLLVGSGDNGGDALHAGALLAGRGARVEALLLADRAHAAGLAALRLAGGRAVRDLDDVHPAPDVVVDGIVGIGGRPGLGAEAVAALDRFAGVPVVAVDVPSGVDVDSAETPIPDHVRADVTVAFGGLKPAHLVDPAAAACGRVVLVDIGLGADPQDAGVESLEDADVLALLPRPGHDDHKYRRGVVGVRAGSEEYPGAALLTLAGAHCGLVGMVRFDGEPSTRLMVASRFPETVGDGRAQAWVLGPGGGPATSDALDELASRGAPLVLDAEALRVLAARRRAGVASVVPAGSVLTPHAGELADLLGVERAQVEAAPLSHVRAAAREWACVVLLKGPRTLVARPDGRARANPTGTPWLATAGAGDVLAGILGALLASGLDAFDAASVAAWLHGAAAQAAGPGPIVASDVANETRRLLHRMFAGTEQSRL